MLIRLPNLSDLLSGSSSPQQNVCTHLGFSCFTLFFTEVVSTCVRVHECVSKRPPPRWKPRCGFLSLVTWLHFKKQNSTWPTSEVKWLTVFFLQGTPKACKKCETERENPERGYFLFCTKCMNIIMMMWFIPYFFHVLLVWIESAYMMEYTCHNTFLPQIIRVRNFV